MCAVLCARLLRLAVPLGPLLACFAVLGASNLALAGRRGPLPAARLLGATLLLDTSLLTVELAFAGGITNPFVAFYLVHVMLAALLTEAMGVALVIAAVVVGCVSLILLPVAPLYLPEPHLGALLVLAFVTGITGIFAIGVVRAFRELHASALAARDAAARSEKLASLATLAAGAAHELATPLGSIAISATELTEMVAHCPEDARTEARIIRQQVERCREILARMGASAGQMSGESPQETLVTTLFAHLRADLGESARRLHTSGDEGKSLRVPVRGLLSVLGNLVTNGLQASEEGASVTLRAEQAGDRVSFLVTDRGGGIPASVVSRLGEPFVTTKAPGAGMGLGLFLARTFAEACGGQLQLLETSPTGTTLRVELPRDVVESHPSRQALS